MEALSSSETSVVKRATQHNILEDGILHSHRRENFKCYKDLSLFSAQPKLGSHNVMVGGSSSSFRIRRVHYILRPTQGTSNTMLQVYEVPRPEASMSLDSLSKGIFTKNFWQDKTGAASYTHAEDNVRYIVSLLLPFNTQ
jgi:hypothetical protein